MKTTLHTYGLRAAGALVAGAMLAAIPGPALAQDNSETRIRKLEAEVRALQRKVFPGGDSRFFEPQIAPGSDSASSATGTPSTTAVTDILVRLDALEGQLQQLTSRSEEQANSLSQLEERLAALESSGSGSASPPPIDRSGSATAAGTDSATSSTAAVPTSAAPDAARLAAVQAIAKPQTDDAGDDEYSYGFRLWSAGFYPEARQQLNAFVERYPNHRRISFGRNLLGRAFLDDGMAEDAARLFLRNYQANKAGDRAPDSLLYLAASMIEMGDTRRACIALAEFGETYPAVATGRLAAEYEANRRKVRCN
jgi:TolA-binding protein